MSENEACLALETGADFLGFVSEMPSGPGVMDLDDIGRIVSALPLGTQSILLASKQSVEEIVQQHKAVKTWGIQLVNSVSPEILSELRSRLPGVKLIPVVHVLNNTSIDEALNLGSCADYVLLDSGKPHKDIPTLGGTGDTHDWSISREICRLSPVPVFLAGGLKSENVNTAISLVKPHALDLCSGVRTHGNLDAEKLARFMGNWDQQR